MIKSMPFSYSIKKALYPLKKKLWQFSDLVRRIGWQLAHPIPFLNRWVTRYLGELGFQSIHSYVVHGPRNRLHFGKNVRPSNSLFFNTRSGHIYIGDGTVFGYNTMFLTGIHLFENGRLKQPKSEQVPREGYDIRIGKGCWVTSGVTIIGGVSIGDHCIIASGAVVTKDFSDGSIIGGVPARLIGYTDGRPISDVGSDVYPPESKKM